MIHKPPEPKGEGCCCDHKSQSTVIYLLYSIISLALLLLNGSFYCKQGILLANMLGSLQGGHHLQKKTESMTFCDLSKNMPMGDKLKKLFK